MGWTGTKHPLDRYGPISDRDHFRPIYVNFGFDTLTNYYMLKRREGSDTFVLTRIGYTNP